ncbi:thioesterase family protein [Lachnobacterium bovis]|uniref:Predicted thioesterase n=1 Tax=Lachnobacterium bovis TaxID=140626 RepID=A0A1H9RDH5_9FIRM|nr:thioesterase family protein [Lachnobacterium bovis]SER70772.1 Predicted thioesterase [Lachnobacterium bovis]
MLNIELIGESEVVVTKDNTAKALKSGELEVFATPAMIALMEEAACNCIAGHLENGQSSVGTKLDIVHISPSPVGMKVTCTARLVAIDNRSLEFEIEARDEKGVIGKGSHSRFIVDKVKFQNKADSKK